MAAAASLAWGTGCASQPLGGGLGTQSSRCFRCSGILQPTTQIARPLGVTSDHTAAVSVELRDFSPAIGFYGLDFDAYRVPDLVCVKCGLLLCE